MVVLLSFAAIAGAAFTSFALSSFGWGIALISAPFGGSLAALAMAAVLVGLRQTPRQEKRTLDEGSTHVSVSAG